MSLDCAVVNGSFSSVRRSSFALEGADCKVNEDVAKSIRDFHAAKKPIG